MSAWEAIGVIADGLFQKHFKKSEKGGGGVGTAPSVPL